MTCSPSSACGSCWPAPEDSEAWKQHLSDWAIRFIRFTRGDGQTASDRMLELVKDTFIIRDNAELLAADPLPGRCSLR
jgi:hypothetical protein